MREFFHKWWPVAAVTLFTVLLVLQIPRKAIFPPTPSEGKVEPFASFVELDDDAYAAVIQNVRMSWQLRARTQFSGGESRTTAFDFDEPVPPPKSLPIDDSFSSPYLAPSAVQSAQDPLLPSSLAQSGVEGLAEAAAAAANPRDADLLVIPDSLSETIKEQTK